MLIDREEDGLFGDNDEELDPQTMQAYYDEFDDPYDILKMMLNYVDNDAGTCLHLASKVNDLLKMIIAKTCCVESVSWSYTKSPYFLHIFFSM